jgi:CheY-like chemotaxis protein
MKKTPKKNGSRILQMKPSTSETKGHILIVEHDDFIRKIVVSMLTSAGYECRQAGGGRKALGFLRAQDRDHQIQVA